MRRDSFWMFGFLVSKSNDMLRTTLVVTDSSRCHWVEHRSQRDLSCGVTRWQIALTCPGLPPICRSTGCFANFCRIPSVLVKLPWLCAPWSRSHGRSGRWIRFRKSSADLGSDFMWPAWQTRLQSAYLRILALFWLFQTNQNMAKQCQTSKRCPVVSPIWIYLIPMGSFEQMPWGPGCASVNAPNGTLTHLQGPRDSYTWSLEQTTRPHCRRSIMKIHEACELWLIAG